MYKIFQFLKKIYNSIPNRVLAFIILILIFGFIFFYTKNNFIENNSKIIINSNISNYEVFLHKNLLKNFERKKFCEQKKCELENVVPMDYKLIIKKKGYKDIIKNFKLNKNTSLKINVFLEKKIDLKKVNNLGKITLTRQEKIKKLKARLKNQTVKKIGKNLYLKEAKIRDRIYIFLNDKEIINFKDKNNAIFFDKIFSVDDEIYIYSGEKIYIFDLLTKSLISFNFKIEPIYIKKINKNYLIITNKGSFIYDKYAKKIDYFYLFRDFVYYKGDIVGIINSGETQKKKNLGLEKFVDNLIIRYNYKTKDKKVIFETKKNIEKIFVKNKKVYIIFSGGETFLLNGL